MEEIKTYFWKRFWFVFIPLYVIAIVNEPLIMDNPFDEFEDIGAFCFTQPFILLLMVSSPLCLSIYYGVFTSGNMDDNV
ncbi:hypothetical protein [Halobacillus litoralis]|uniref:hypothetical protein n=1 Tax=Halobacillus litoralis TaxID=45668 RepID=UPI0024933082|nr:hypothetical protein [Halobacillus litoralis]